MVLSGGISKGAYQLGFIRSLLKYADREEIKTVAGSSMGMLCSYALSADKLDTLECIFRSIQIEKKSELLYEVFFKKLLWKEIPAFVSTNDDLTIPFVFPVCYIPLYDVRYYWTLGKNNPIWEKYLRAAINYPFLCIIPSVLEGRLAIDGGAADNIPIYPLLKSGKEYLGEGETYDLIIALHFDARYDYRREFTTDIPVLDIDLGICNDFKKHHYDFSLPFIEEMIEKGAEYGDRICERIFSSGCSREDLQRVVNEIFVEEHEARQKNISIDRFFSMLNIIGRALRKDSKCIRKLY